MLIVFLLKLWAWIVLFAKAVGLLAVLIFFTIVAIVGSVFIWSYICNIRFKHQLPSLLNQALQDICTHLHDENNRLASDMKIDVDTWSSVNATIRRISDGSIPILDQTQVSDTVSVPSLIWEIHHEWEVAQTRRTEQNMAIEDDEESDPILRIKLRHTIVPDPEPSFELEHAMHQNILHSLKPLLPRLACYRRLRYLEQSFGDSVASTSEQAA